MLQYLLEPLRSGVIEVRQHLLHRLIDDFVFHVVLLLYDSSEQHQRQFRWYTLAVGESFAWS